MSCGPQAGQALGWAWRRRSAGSRSSTPGWLFSRSPAGPARGWRPGWTGCGKGCGRTARGGGSRCAWPSPDASPRWTTPASCAWPRSTSAASCVTSAWPTCPRPRRVTIVVHTGFAISRLDEGGPGDAAAAGGNGNGRSRGVSATAPPLSPGSFPGTTIYRQQSTGVPHCCGTPACGNGRSSETYLAAALFFGSR